MPQKGYGLCGICHEQIGDPTPPLRYFKGHAMAHKTCVDAQEAYELTDEYKLERARAKVAAATNKLHVAQNDLLSAQRELIQLTGATAE